MLIMFTPQLRAKKTNMMRGLRHRHKGDHPKNVWILYKVFSATKKRRVLRACQLLWEVVTFAAFFHPIVSITAIKILQQQTVTVVQNLTQTRKSHQTVVINFVIKGCLVVQKLVIFHSPSRVKNHQKRSEAMRRFCFSIDPRRPCSREPLLLDSMEPLPPVSMEPLWLPWRRAPGHQQFWGTQFNELFFLGKIYMETIDCPIKF